MPIRNPLFWLDFSPEDTRGASDLIREMLEDGVLDEMGFGVLQNSLANRFYPATSTIMTASRYLFFVPAIYDHLEQLRVPSSKMHARAKEMQDQLREILRDTEPNNGVIGLQAGRDLKRFPSSIYWNALRRLELFRRDFSESTYQSQLDRAYAKTGQKDDDKALLPEDSEGCWDSKRPAASFLEEGHFRAGISFRLTRAEANDLRRRYVRLFPDSLLAYQVTNGIPELEFPWKLPDPPAALARILQHARILSALAQGVLIQYYQLLQEARDHAGLSVAPLNLGEAFASWFERARPLLERWNLDSFFTHEDVAPALRRNDMSFLSAWRARALAASGPAELFDEARAREVVRERERSVKPYKARLLIPRYLATWDPSILSRANLDLPYALFYRHRVGRRFAAEILQGLKGEG